MAAAVETISFILTLFGAGVSIGDLTSSKATITIDQVTGVVRSELVRFNNTVTEAAIETINTNFTKIFLPTIEAAQKTITKSDLETPAGRLYNVITDIKTDIGKFQGYLDTMLSVFKTYYEKLHPDELTRGYTALLVGYTRLLHMQAIFVNLHRIQVGATSEEDKSVVSDTLTTLTYARAAIKALNEMGDHENGIVSKSRIDRLAARTGWGGVEDSYSPQTGTKDDEKLSISHDNIKVWNKYAGQYDFVSSENPESLFHFDDLAPELKERVKTRVKEVLKTRPGATDALQKLVNKMVERAKKQGISKP